MMGAIAASSAPPPTASDLVDRAAAIDWYHSIELAPGNVTEGEFDLRPYVDHYGLPAVMRGRRAIDVAAADGFWAFEMERRGASVVAIDLSDAGQLDWPAFRPRMRDRPLGKGFELAREVLGSSVERVEASVYDITPAELGTFDVVFCGSLLIHLKNQLLALERMAQVLRPGGSFISAEPYSRWLTALPFPVARFRAHLPGAPVFWEPSVRAWTWMLQTCGFADVRRRGTFAMESSRGYTVRHVVHHASRRHADH